jgi:periplasmic protein CpxP/Spy
MRFSRLLIVSTIVLAAALAVPWVIRPALVAQSTLSSGSSALSNPTSPAGRKRGGILSKLNLTQAQFRQIAEIRRKYQPSIRDRTRTVRRMQSELQGLMASSAEPAAVQAKFKQLQTHRQELQQLRFDSSLAVRQVLTPAQRQRFETELSKRRPNQPNQPNQ